MTRQKAPIFSDVRYQKELEERNQRKEMAKQKRKDELDLKELEEAEELAKNYVHKNKSSARLDLDAFNKKYELKMLARNRKIKLMEEELEKEFE